LLQATSKWLARFGEALSLSCFALALSWCPGCDWLVRLVATTQDTPERRCLRRFTPPPPSSMLAEHLRLVPIPTEQPIKSRWAPRAHSKP
jgi:hypothetical protein